MAPTEKMPANSKQQPGYCDDDGHDDGGGCGGDHDGDDHDGDGDGSNREDAIQFQMTA